VVPGDNVLITPGDFNRRRQSDTPEAYPPYALFGKAVPVTLHIFI